MGYQRELEEGELELSVKVEVRMSVPIAHLPESAGHELLDRYAAADGAKRPCKRGCQCLECQIDNPNTVTW